MGAREDPIRKDLMWIAEDFSRILAAAEPDGLDAATDGTRWTNRQLLFHMLLGQEITRTFIPMIGGFSRLPPSASKVWSAVLGSVSGPYNWVNWAGAVAGARVLSLGRMRRMMDTATSRIVAWYDHADDRGLSRGMSVPPSWDPYFLPWMDRRDLLGWAPKHYRHHRRQLTLPLPSSE